MAIRFPILAAAAALALAMTSAPSGAQPTTIAGEHGPVAVAVVAAGLAHPWGLDFLPDGRVLVTERPGRLRIVGADGGISEPLAGVPKVYAERQGGLLDVRVGPDFATDRRIYLSFAEPGPGGASTAVARGRLEGHALTGVEVIFSQRPISSKRRALGSGISPPASGPTFSRKLPPLLAISMSFQIRSVVDFHL